MKVVTLSESENDEEAILVLARASTIAPLELAPGPALKARGVKTLLQFVPGAIRYCLRIDADGLIVVADSDHTEVHSADHGRDQRKAHCRLCNIHAAIDAQLEELKHTLRYRPVEHAAGIAVPAIEAWALYGVDALASEAAWAVERGAGRHLHIKVSFKQAVFGDRVGLGVRRSRLVEAMERVSGDIEGLIAAFPNGCGPLIADLRRWPVPVADSE